MVFYRHVYFPIIPRITENPINGKRHYTIPSGKHLPSVTTALSLYGKDGIDVWRKRVGETKANEITKDSLNVGTIMHSLIEDYLGNVATESYDQKHPVSKKLFEQLKPELHKINNIRAQELGVYSETLGVAGRMDCLAEYDGTLSVIDFKSATKKKKPEWVQSYFLQATAYSLMVEELTKVSAPQLVILISGRDESVDAFKVDRADYVEKLKNVLEDYHLRVEFG